MPTTTDPLAAYKIAENLRECAHQRLLDTPGGEPSRSCVIAGDIAWDDCECGQLVVAINRIFMSQNFPAPADAAPTTPPSGPCGPPISVIEYTISILRCAPIGQDASPPTCPELDQAAQIATHDAWAVRWGAWCCLRKWRKSRDPELSITDFRIGQQVMVGPQGMCQGSELQVLVGIINACPPCPEAAS